MIICFSRIRSEHQKEAVRRSKGARKIEPNSCESTNCEIALRSTSLSLARSPMAKQTSCRGCENKGECCMKPRRTLLALIAMVAATVWTNVAVAQGPIVRPLPSGTIVGPQWNGWENLGGSLASEPTCLAPAENRIECYASSTTGVLQRQEWNGVRWSGWETFPGVTIQHFNDRTGPSCFLDNARLTHCFVVGSDDALWHRWFPPGSNGWWENLGGRLTSSPACTAAPDVASLDCVRRQHS